MTQTESMQAKQQYNEVAVRIAEALQHARQAIRKQIAGVEIPRERLFPPFNRAGLGIALEYERMGHRPVSEELQARADELGFELEHLGITIGSVIHGIDLKKADAPEEILFVRNVRRTSRNARRTLT